jgi:histidinol dehydrogenase
MRVARGVAEARKLLRRDDSLASAVSGEGSPMDAVAKILHRVRESGDKALRELTCEFDGHDIDVIEVPRAAFEEARREVSAGLVDALELAAERIRKYHRAVLPKTWIDYAEGYGELVIPVDRVGAYVPGGTAPLVSTALMTAIPARIAGVREVVMASPPGENGLPAPAVLVAADIAGVDRVFRVGGAQAIAAMAYGTETVPRVDVVCGPGSIYVTLAKRLVYGDVGIDGLFGPTETVVIADGHANPTLCAADLLAQAEHDVLARPVLITTSPSLAKAVDREVAIRVQRLDRVEIATRAVNEQGCIVVVDDLEQAFALGNEFAPEHMCLMLEDPWSYAGRIKNAGAVFLGDFSYEVLGDYVAGPSHVMPTGGTARFGSGLGVRAFLKFTPIVGLDDATSAEVSKAAAIIARAEGLTGHAEAAEIRQELERGQGEAQ